MVGTVEIEEGQADNGHNDKQNSLVVVALVQPQVIPHVYARKEYFITLFLCHKTR